MNTTTVFMYRCMDIDFDYKVLLYHCIYSLTTAIVFLCYSKNMILMDVIERRTIQRTDYFPDREPKEFEVQRELAQAMIPGKHLVKVEIDKDVFEKRMKDQPQQQQQWKGGEGKQQV